MPSSVSFRSRCLTLFLTVALGACKEPHPEPIAGQMASIAIVADASTSSDIAHGKTIADLRCPEVVGTVEQALTSKGLRQLDVLAVAAGGRSTSYEARVIIPWRSFTPTSRLFGKNKRVGEQRQAFLKEIEETCRSALKSEQSSPIFFAIERAATSLAQHAAALPQSHEATVSRSLIVLTDGRENVHQGIKSRLLTVSKALRVGKTPPTRPNTVPVLKLSAVAVRVCGLAEHTGGNSDDLMASPEAVTATWQEILPEASFDASCRRSASLGPVTSIGGDQ